MVRHNPFAELPDPGDDSPYPEPSAQGLYRDREGDWWVHRSDGGWALVYWEPQRDDEWTFTAPTHAELVCPNWAAVPKSYKPFRHITYYPGV